MLNCIGIMKILKFYLLIAKKEIPSDIHIYMIDILSDQNRSKSHSIILVKLCPHVTKFYSLVFLAMNNIRSLKLLKVFIFSYLR